MAQSVTKWRVDASRPPVRGCALRASGERVGRLGGRSWHKAGDEACAHRGCGGALSSDPRAARGTGFWRVAATGAGRAARLRGRGPEGQKWPEVLFK
jgi:hypothetical protein